MTRYHLDWLLIIPSLLLLGLGITILQSVAPELVRQQAIVMVIGIIVAFLMSRTNYRVLENFSWIIYALTLALLLATFLIGQATRGSVRWIPLGFFHLQTSEIAKPLLIIFFAHFLNTKMVDNLKQVITSLILLAIPMLLIFRQPDLGSALVLAALWLGMMFVVGLPFRYLISGGIIISLLIPIGWHVLADYQKARLVTFINPTSDPLKKGYHLTQSIIAVGSGQIWGRGLGQGTQSQLRFLPERHTDFIFASLSEELGLFGGILVTGLLTLLLARILIVARHTSDKFGELICVGVFSMLAFQAFINIGMNIGLVPITGITLPFISYGGSSLLSVFMSVGLVGSVSVRQDHKHQFEIH